MGFYGFLRLGVVPIAIALWVFHQLVIKRRPFSEFKSDVYAALFFIGVYLLLIYWLIM
jgi:hypothetical protein